MTLPISATTTQIHQKRVLCALVKRQLVSPFSILPSANLFQLHKATNIYKYIAKHLSTIYILNDDECLTGIRRTTTTNTTRDADLLLLVNTRYDHLFIFPQHQHHTLREQFSISTLRFWIYEFAIIFCSCCWIYYARNTSPNDEPKFQHLPEFIRKANEINGSVSNTHFVPFEMFAIFPFSF